MREKIPPNHLVVFGRPGSGKSTLAERLGSEFGYTLIRTGELLRAAIRRQDFLGKRVEAHLATGDLVPDPLIFEMLEQHLKAPGMQKFLFDGFPRTMGQVPLLEGFEKKLGFQIGAYIDIAVSHAEAVARMTGRRVCPICGATYHLIGKPPRVAEICDNDGARLEKRKDDTPEVVEFRQKIFDDYAVPILRYYQEHAPERFFVVDGEQPLEAVYAVTVRALGLA
ncbi:MAG: adenylate kinase family protein [Planctomycetota bacterium]|nr:adenylate kinase family protein [Planctomycetota bacterium]